MASSTSCLGLKWAAQQIGMKSELEVDADVLIGSGNDYLFDCDSHKLRGVQSIGYDANIDPQVIFEICAGAIYDIDEGLPTVDITINKALDGHTPVYLVATRDADEPTLLGRANCKSNIGISYFDCDSDSACGEAKSTVVMTDVQVTSIGYTFGVDGVFSEDISFTGNNLIWRTRDTNPIYNGSTINPNFQAIVDTISFSGCCCDNSPSPAPKVQFKEDFVFDYSGFVASGTDENGYVCDPDITVLPQSVYGISPNGLNDSGICIQSISFSTDLNREEVFCLGSRAPTTRTPTLPIQVDTTIEVLSDAGGAFSFYEDGAIMPISGYCTDGIEAGCVCSDKGINRKYGSIRVVLCGGLRISTGTRNFLAGVSTNGASTDGDNLAVTYTFRNYNVFTVLHKNDTAPSGADWWNNRDQWLCGN